MTQPSTNQPNRPLSGRTALITGAASGIGRAITERFAQDGAEVIAVDRDADRLGKTCADTGATPLVIDLSDIAGLPEDEVLAKIMLTSSPVKRLIEPAEVAAAAAFLCSSTSNSMTGSQIVLDGGWGAR